MPPSNPQEKNIERLQIIKDLLAIGDSEKVAEKLRELHAAEIAHILESVPRELREQIWKLLEPETVGEVLLNVNDEVRKSLINDTSSTALVAAIQHLDADDIADIIPDLPGEVATTLLQSIDEQHRRRVDTTMSYPEDTAGGLMNIDTITVRAQTSLDVVLRYLRFRGEIPEMTDNLIVVDRNHEYVGNLPLTELLIKDPTLSVADVMNRDMEPIPVDMSDHDVAHLFEKRDLVSAPVVDHNNKLLGRITIDDVVDVMREEADHSIMSRAGLTEEDDMFAPVIASSRRRTTWLAINLLTAILASWVISHFETTIQQLVALAVLMPIVASMGGVAGSQTLTLVIRGIALGQVSGSNAFQLLKKELLVGVLNGLVWALVVGVIAVVWFGNNTLGIIIGAAMLINLIVAALAGAIIPITLNRLRIDPALAGGVVLTTVTDVIGFLVFLGMAAMFLI